MQPGGRQRRGASGGVSILYLPGRPPKCPRPRQPVVLFNLSCYLQGVPSFTPSPPRHHHHHHLFTALAVVLYVAA